MLGTTYWHILAQKEGLVKRVDGREIKMVMARNEYVARVAMLLCFGTAILSLVVHWYLSASTTPVESSAIQTQGAATAADTTSLRKLGVSGPLQLLWAKVSTPKTLPFSAPAQQTKVVVDLSDRRVYVYRFGQVIASYPTGIGKKGWETPTGTFQVTQKQLHPAWRHPITGKVFPAGADSPLGDRWIGFWSDGRNQIGFHGTPDDELVGSAVSHGCLRMRNPDVRLLYEQVSLGTPVEVRH
jgi:lipoprotein-anchoring transpeptidase ErfK/SrfK